MFITLEGGEGAGKSTQARLLAEALRRTGRDAVLTREPGGTDGAEALRRLILSPEHRWAPSAETMLHFAARADHVERLIRPALARGAVVVCDRFTDSTVAYQGYGQGADFGLIESLHAALGIDPDLTFVLRVTPEIAGSRLAARARALDRYEVADKGFHARVRAGFDAVAAASPGRCVVVDGDGPADDIHAAIWREVEARA